jgi:hypothetical protein
MNVTPFTPVVTPVQTLCPTPANTSLPVWMTMNPIAEHHLGDVFEVNGTIQQKNWTAENAVKIHVQIECSSPGYRLIWPKGIAIQHPSDCEVQTWSYQVNLSGEGPAGECSFFAYTIERDGHSRYAIFNVTPRNSDISVGGERVSSA